MSNYFTLLYLLLNMQKPLRNWKVAEYLVHHFSSPTRTNSCESNELRRSCRRTLWPVSDLVRRRRLTASARRRRCQQLCWTNDTCHCSMQIRRVRHVHAYTVWHWRHGTLQWNSLWFTHRRSQFISCILVVTLAMLFTAPYIHLVSSTRLMSIAFGADPCILAVRLQVT